MKQKLIYTLIFIISFISFSAQNAKAVMEINYEMKQISDSTNRKNAAVMEFTLFCNKEESVYYNKDAKNFYDALNKNTGNKKNWTISNTAGMPKFPKVRGSVHKIREKLSVSLPVAKDIYQFEEPELKWEVLQETKEIKGFKCQLAKTITDTHDTFYAWFARDIPIQDGPFRFKGLTGLILEVYNKNKTIEIYATDIKKSDAVMEPIDYGRAIELKSKGQFLKMRSHYLQDPTGFNNHNIQVTDQNGNDLNKKIDEKIKKINVFLD
ncbi:GLPGLI family protein [Chryseobacterium defluvii]|uniref:GLPGLI family protein n=1 Tax=Chryseobacterium defluvii TaxID=160396 RepID=A0A840KEJ3_9FLAO|nr:GLPGLI family protein [Chryseobacterium defluvii]MBB4806418.1 GLPGLI family protein [Chryseobacterium defluvii]